MRLFISQMDAQLPELMGVENNDIDKNRAEARLQMAGPAILSENH